MHPRLPELVTHSFYTFIFYVVEECHSVNIGYLYSITCKLFNFFVGVMVSKVLVPDLDVNHPQKDHHDFRNQPNSSNRDIMM